MRRARFTLGCLAGVVVAWSAGWACIPHPEDDFEDFQGRAEALPKPVIEASTFEAAPPPTQSVEGLYYGACLSELAFGNDTKVFNFYTLTKFTPGDAGGKLVLSIQGLEVTPPPTAPPPTVAKAGTVGVPFEATADVDAQAKFLIQ
ncbi:MAG TPA: hypothetical protein VM925_10800, partial [Labilithrix sp.]|nr:hypothetical protein [Labilithrix sp.]